MRIDHRLIDSAAEMHAKGNLRDYHELNQFLESEEAKDLLTFLGVHIVILGYVDPQFKTSLHYLTEDRGKMGEPNRRQVRWPYFVDGLEGGWRRERDSIAETRLKLASVVRLAEYSQRDRSVSRSLEALGALAHRGTISGAYRIEERQRVLYAPMGEILAGLLGWHFECFLGGERDESFILGGGELDYIRESIRDSATATLLNGHRDKLKELAGSQFPRALLKVTDAPGLVSWQDVFEDLGLVTRCREMQWNRYRLEALIEWLAAQAVPESLLRRSRVELDEDSLALLQNLRSQFMLYRGGRSDLEECLEPAIASLIAMVRFSNVAWENLFHFGLGNHLLWLAVGRDEKERWIAPYDWAAFEVLPGEIDLRDRPLDANAFLPHGVAFLTMRAQGLSDCVHLALGRRLSWIKSVILGGAAMESRLTYFGKILGIDSIARNTNELLRNRQE